MRTQILGRVPSKVQSQAKISVYTCSVFWSCIKSTLFDRLDCEVRAKVETIPLSEDKITEPTGSLEFLKREKGCYWAMITAILNEINRILPWILLKSFAPLRVESYSIRDSLRYYTEKRSDEPNFEALLKNKTYTRKLSLHKTRKHLIVPGTLCGKCWWNRKVWLLSPIKAHIPRLRGSQRLQYF